MEKYSQVRIYNNERGFIAYYLDTNSLVEYKILIWKQHIVNLSVIIRDKTYFNPFMLHLISFYMIFLLVSRT